MKASSAWSLVGAGLLFLAVVLIVRAGGLAEEKGREEARAYAKAREAFPREAKSDSSRTESKSQRAPESAENPRARLNQIHMEGTYEHNLMRSMLGPFDPAELRRVAEDPQRDERRFLELLLRAAAERDPSFRDLLGRPALRQDPQAELGLLTYAFSITRNREALEKILKLHTETPPENRTWDSNEIMALAVIDEWDLTRKALVAHQLSGDGSGGDAKYAFWLRRRYLFPQDKSFPQSYEEFTRQMREAQLKNDPDGGR